MIELNRVKEIQDVCLKKNKKLVVYLSMGFGNPYGDTYNTTLVFQYADQLVQEGISILSLADTVGVATAQQVHEVTGYLINALPDVEIGVHLHSTIQNWRERVEAAYNVGCRWFDGALKGIGG